MKRCEWLVGCLALLLLCLIVPIIVLAEVVIPSASLLKFEGTMTGTTAWQKIIVKNVSSDTIFINNVILKDEDFSQFKVNLAPPRTTDDYDPPPSWLPPPGTPMPGGPPSPPPYWARLLPVNQEPLNRSYLIVTFAPTSVGMKKTTMVIVHSAAGNSLLINLTGTGVYPPSQPIPEWQPTGPPSLDFRVTNTKGQINPEDNAFVVRFFLDAQNFRIRGGGILWNFGDGETSKEPHPQHFYRQPGEYTVKVSVTNDETGEVYIKTKEKFVVVTERPPKVDFSAAPSIGLTPLIVEFHATNSGGAITSYQWNFGEGNPVSSTADAISHIYMTAGAYTVTLTVTGPGGSDSKRKENLISVIKPQPVIGVLPASIGFGNVEVEQKSAPSKVTISNIGNGMLEVSSVALFGANPADFSASPTVFNIVAGGLARTVEVVFVPKSSGSKSASLHIYHNAAGSPSLVGLSGVGVPPPPPVESNVGAFLAFPLPKRDPYNVRINSVFDHSMDRGSYTADGIVVAYTGERGEIKYGQDYVTTINGNRLSGYQSSTVPIFKVNGNYWGGGRQEFLYYDGHPGFDYRTRDNDQDPENGQINVLAAADGTAHRATSDTYNEIYIDHGNRYTTHYFHLSRRIVLDGAKVKKGDIIGISGDKGAVNPHLHFEVRLNTVPVDPYGWQGSGRDPYDSQAKNVNLWIKSTVPPKPPTPDFNGDGVVDIKDLFLFADVFGHSAMGDNAKFDLDGNGEIGFTDFFIFTASFGKRV